MFPLIKIYPWCVTSIVHIFTNCKWLIYYPIFLSIWEMFFNPYKWRREFNIPSSSQGPNLECPQVFMGQHLLWVTVCIPLEGSMCPQGKDSQRWAWSKGGHYHILSGPYILPFQQHRMWWDLALTLYLCIYTKGNRHCCWWGSIAPFVTSSFLSKAILLLLHCRIWCT